MRAAAAQTRWLMSFVDLCLLLIAFFVLLHARSLDPRQLAAGMRAGFGAEAAAGTLPLELAASDLFEPGEAVLRPDAAARLRAAGAAAVQRGERAFVTGTGGDAGGARLDRWELAAARAAAVARALRSGGLGEARIEVALPGGGTGPQRLRVAFAG
ncbi:OmpA family protein [Sphingomonas jatrophae]|uniref:OmpA family protein n=1 Tax=Sphingomonas jatrophae TaxID=1166337 RepID=A0A1I6MAS4_9SPHN|nr:OmpA family protein [Sphingomonas jatrophae]SFS12826.1 OmpA family protein [Sphingomonas jatrophae]